MSSTVFVINSPLHYIHSLSILKTINKNDNYFILWFGSIPLIDYFPNSDIVKKYPVIDLTHFRFNHYSGYRNNINNLIFMLKNKIKKIDYLFTCFDTHYGFEVVRNYFSVSWSQIGIIEDGIGNYFPNRMPALNKQLIKSLINKIQFSYFFNVSRLNLGGNPKIGFISTLSPKYLYLHPNSKAKILDTRKSFVEVIKKINACPPAIYNSAEVIIFMSAVLNYKRMNSVELTDYLNKVLSNKKISPYNNFVLKPHPREDLDQLKNIVNKNFNNQIVIADVSPVEIYFPLINPKVLAGMPTTAILYHYFISNNSADYILFPMKGLKYLDRQINVFKKILSKNIDVLFL